MCVSQVLELLVQRDQELQDLMEVAQQQGKVQEEMQLLEKEVEKRDSDIQQLQKQLKEAEHILVRLHIHTNQNTFIRPTEGTFTCVTAQTSHRQLKGLLSAYLNLN